MQQFNQPFFNTSFPSNGFCFPFNTTFQTQCARNPDVVGEGDVVSLILPDGSVQLFFLPTNKWCTSYPAFPNNQNYWFVKNVASPIPHPVYCQNQSPPCAISYPPSPFTYGCSTSFDVPNVCYPSQNQNVYCPPLKFHNDAVSSTTDIHYFYPRTKRPCAPNPCAGVQVVCSARNDSCQSDAVMCASCNCNPQNCKCKCVADCSKTTGTSTHANAEDTCKCSKNTKLKGVRSQHSQVSMSVDECESSTKSRKRSRWNKSKKRSEDDCDCERCEKKSKSKKRGRRSKRRNSSEDMSDESSRRKKSDNKRRKSLERKVKRNYKRRSRERKRKRDKKGKNKNSETSFNSSASSSSRSRSSIGRNKRDVATDTDTCSVDSKTSCTGDLFMMSSDSCCSSATSVSKNGRKNKRPKNKQVSTVENSPCPSWLCLPPSTKQSQTQCCSKDRAKHKKLIGKNCFNKKGKNMENDLRESSSQCPLINFEALGQIETEFKKRAQSFMSAINESIAPYSPFDRPKEVPVKIKVSDNETCVCTDKFCLCADEYANAEKRQGILQGKVFSKQKNDNVTCVCPDITCLCSDQNTEIGG